MRLKKIACIEEVNRYLVEEYLSEHNRRFTVGAYYQQQRPAAGKEDYHLPSPPERGALRAVLRLETERAQQRLGGLRHANRCYQVERQHQAAQSKVMVCE
jgi:hypothetical protein